VGHHTEEELRSMGTIKVRIAVAVAREKSEAGHEWCAAGAAWNEEYDSVDDAAEPFTEDHEQFVIVWVEADVPMPDGAPIITVQGTVQP
jgi:hypothetical protein